MSSFISILTGSSSLVAGNIKKGVNIFGVVGSAVEKTMLYNYGTKYHGLSAAGYWKFETDCIASTYQMTLSYTYIYTTESMNFSKYSKMCAYVKTGPYKTGYWFIWAYVTINSTQIKPSSYVAAKTVGFYEVVIPISVTTTGPIEKYNVVGGMNSDGAFSYGSGADTWIYKIWLE